MVDYRYKILIALRLRKMPWLETPRIAMNDFETSNAIGVRQVAPARRAEMGSIANQERVRLIREEAREVRQQLGDLFNSDDQQDVIDLENEWNQCY